MDLPYHRLSRDLFAALAAGGGGPTAVRELAAVQSSRRFVMLRGVRAAAREANGEQYRFARLGYDLLASVQQNDPAALDRVIGHPSVGAWALRTLLASRGAPGLPGAEPSGLSAVAAAAAVRARHTAEIEVTSVGGIVALPSLGGARVEGRTAIVRSTRDGAEVCSRGLQVSIPPDPHADAPGWLGLRRVQAGGLDVVIDDLDPFRMPALPDLTSRLTDTEISKWKAALEQAWPLLEKCPVIASEVAAGISTIVPLHGAAYHQVSSSSPETFGAIAMSEPSDPYTCAVTLAHEVQHVKLSALLDIVALTSPDDGHRYYAPWRDDPRPVSGLLQGAYAYLGVSGFWRRHRQLTAGAERKRAEKEFARWRAAVAQVVDTLRSSGRLTSVGLDFVQGMKSTLSGWLEESVPAGSEARARHEADLHRAHWHSRNGEHLASRP